MNASGQVVGQLSYDSYGNITNSRGTLPDFGYAGLLYHQPTGLELATYRAYDPLARRWLSRDPIRERGGVNLYAYVNDEPVGSIDLLGWAIIHGVPTGSVTYTAPNGTTFYAPPTANFPAEQAAGNANGKWNVSGISKAIGQGGTYDYQRSGGNFYPAYTNASNYGVGAYMEGAGYSETMMDAIAKLYAYMNSSNAGSSNQITWWNYGWEAAKSGKLPKPPIPCR